MTQSGNDEPIVEKDMSYSPSSEREVARNQDDTVDSRAGEEGAVSSDEVKVLPGTGGPDDVGDVEMPPGEYHPKGDATPESRGD
jgi:hypothetical protein